MKKKVVSLLMICALSVGMLAGCGSSETQNQATGSADNYIDLYTALNDTCHIPRPLLP